MISDMNVSYWSALFTFVQIDKMQNLLWMICLSRQVDGYTKSKMSLSLSHRRHSKASKSKYIQIYENIFMCHQNAMYIFYYRKSIIIHYWQLEIRVCDQIWISFGAVIWSQINRNDSNPTQTMKKKNRVECTNVSITFQKISNGKNGWTRIVSEAYKVNVRWRSASTQNGKKKNEIETSTMAIIH